jgi:hypothetical protein
MIRYQSLQSTSFSLSKKLNIGYDPTLGGFMAYRPYHEVAHYHVFIKHHRIPLKENSAP